MYPIIQKYDNYTVTEQQFFMRDGTALYTRIIVPTGGEKFPAVFIRTPYDPAMNGTPCEINGIQLSFVNGGYAVVHQHCRGTGDSEGFCIPYSAAERTDGLDTLELIRTLPFYNSEIYLWGMSYLSTVHYMYLDPCPPDIKGAVLSVQTDRMYFRYYPNGCCSMFCGVDWYLDRLKRQYPQQDKTQIAIRPHKGMVRRAIGEDVPSFTAFLINDTYNDFWQKDPRTNIIENWKIPVLFTEGWYDFYNAGMFSMWQRLPEAEKARSAFVVGPWGHATKVAENCPYPLPNGNVPEDCALQWFNSIRNKTPYPYAKTGCVNYYSIGGDKWNTAVYPCVPKEQMRLYFQEDRTLTQQPNRTDAQISYLYDPDKTPGYFRHHNIYEAAPANSIPDVISFQSMPFTQECSFYGCIHWHMDVSSDCEDTAFYIRVSFVENGIAYNLTDTITSLSYLAADYRPGEQLSIDLDTPPIAFTLKKGSSLRVDISSHSDLYVPHANVKGHWAEVTECKIANNTLHLKDAYIALPLE